MESNETSNAFGNAPRVTPEQVEAAIIGETYTVLPNGRTTVCQLTLDNGFTVEGMSAGHDFNRIHDQLAAGKGELHSLVVHCNAVADADHGKFDR